LLKIRKMNHQKEIKKVVDKIVKNYKPEITKKLTELGAP